MVADPHFLTDLNIVDHTHNQNHMVIRNDHTCPLATQSIITSVDECGNCTSPVWLSFLQHSASYTVLTFPTVDTSAEDFSPNAGCGVDLYPSKKFYSTSSIILFRIL
ncbi:unnamed protein product [Hymenolepis diminuta]|uniref:Uncharacterized protein n=1 Tax=Hymenolepis diminuta TaxID=6216 RepID=A0A564Z3G9_HYMDI|nr:unnamed protein product [Hymenolepis diminuta]